MCRTDVKGYYANINHRRLKRLLRPYLRDKIIQNLVHQFIHRSIEDGGLFKDTTQQGICRGCSLSPVLGAFFLAPLDNALSRLRGVFYARFMDDWVLLSHTHDQLQHAMITMNGILETLKLTKHPDKTEIGLIREGFTFLGSHIAPLS